MTLKLKAFEKCKIKAYLGHNGLLKDFDIQNNLCSHCGFSLS
jgi:ribosomal protein L37E